MPQLSRTLATDFGRAIKERGQEYFHDGRVTVRSGSPWRVLATVRGTLPYEVELKREDPMVSASCTCPYFDVEPCKHIWAVVLAADEQRFLLGKGGGRNRPLYLVARDLEGIHPARSAEEQATTAGAILDDGLDLPGPKSGATAPPGSAFLGGDLAHLANGNDWRDHLARVRSGPMLTSHDHREELPETSELLYVITAGKPGPDLDIEVLVQDLKHDGTRGKPRRRRLSRDGIDHLPNPDDRRLLALMAGPKSADTMSGFQYAYPHGTAFGTIPSRYRLSPPQPELLLPEICATGRCRLRPAPGSPERDWLPLTWDDGEEWEFHLAVRPAERPDRYEVVGAFHRDAERLDLASVALILESGILFGAHKVARFKNRGNFEWISLLTEQERLFVPNSQREEFLVELLSQPELPAVDLPSEFRYEEIRGTPRPCLVIKREDDRYAPDRLHGTLGFDYEGTYVGAGQQFRGIVQTAERRVLLRDKQAETAAGDELRQLGWRHDLPGLPNRNRQDFLLPISRLSTSLRDLLKHGWHIEAEGHPVRSMGRSSLSIASGVDWFELHGDVVFDGEVAHLPELLRALHRGEDTILLSDGSLGILPQEWLQQYGLLGDLGTVQGDHIRFARSQAGLLDALLATQPEVRCDEHFAAVREQLAGFTGVEAANPPAGFHGELRAYQKEGLGWLKFLHDLRFGGCLADDMGLGKTVQVLAWLETRRTRRRDATDDQLIPPSLIVVPKSLLFNWQQEAARFTPGIRVLEYTGSTRSQYRDQLDSFDIILTTYGTVRNDIVWMRERRFDYVILDESQAIKNAQSVAAKAVRLLQADHRLALSGTPIENHLGELWSLFEFLNPGMLGAVSAFKLVGTASRTLDEETRQLLSRALRPFLLRRTKEQVALDLPPRIEQTLYCEMGKKQQKLYDDLRDHYRVGLLQHVARDGIGGTHIQILEALLRLRQAAIHPGLLDHLRAKESSAKLDMLVPQLVEIVDAGHKALVFSQFTGMLSILRDKLDHHGLTYAYLDGKTRDREARVRQFQEDPDCRLFLISLKAGGVGLNLTAAQYVFLLDPWWNPAVEAQAIDRAHRIGQSRQVVAYRLITRNTIEEKVLELQQSKRELADSIIGTDKGLIRQMTREDLDLLLS